MARSNAQVHRRFAVPAPPLGFFVERIWSWAAGADVLLPRVLPGAGAELFIHAGAPFAVEAPDGRLVRLGAGHFLCLRTRSAQLVASGPLDFVAIRFRTGALSRFTSVAPAELHDRFATADEALGADAHALVDAIGAASGFEDRVRHVERILTRILRRRGVLPSVADRAVARLYYRAGIDQVRDVADYLGTSERYLERVVGAATGLTPKRLQRIARFHHVMRRLLLESRSDYLGTALEHGYFDQAHFIHEVKALAGTPPGRILTRQAFESHFYNPHTAMPGQPPDHEHADSGVDRTRR